MNNDTFTSNKMYALYKPFLSSLKNIDLSTTIADSKIITESAASIASLQMPLLDKSITTLVDNMHLLKSLYPKEIIASDFSEIAQNLLESIHPAIDMMNTSLSVFKENAFNNNYGEMLRSFSDLGYDISSLANQAYEETDENTSDDFNTNEEIVEALQEQTNNPVGFQEKVANWSEEKKKKYYLIVGIILFIWTNFIAPYFQDNVGKPVVAYTISKVKEVPNVAGKVIGEFMEGIEGLITEDVPYYYKVTYTDVTGEEKEGYVAKKNLKVIEKANEEASDNQED